MSELSKARPFQCGLLFIICLLGLKMWRALGPCHDLKTQARVQLGVFVSLFHCEKDEGATAFVEPNPEGSATESSRKA